MDKPKQQDNNPEISNGVRGKNALVRYFLFLVKWVWVNIFPGVAVTIVILLILGAGGEVYFRKKLPFNQPTWPSRFDKQYGWTFAPGETVNWTNHLDYWTSTRVNSLGFLDREPPPIDNSSNTCRVAFIGDSMVEAAQVPIDDKMQVQFEKIANRASPNGPIYQTFAFGFSGSGQVNQIPFYDVFAKPLKPDVVVLVFVNNDFANNSTALESIRNGWHPLHPPRLFFEYDGQKNTFSKIDIDPNWQNYLLPAVPPVTPNIAGATSWLSNHSYLYNEMNSMFFAKSQRLSSFLTGTPPISEIYKAHLKEVEKIDRYANKFGSWDPAIIDMDYMFKEDKLPPAFEEALSITGYALDQFKERSVRDNFKLIILTNYGVSTIDNGKRKMFDRIYHLADERGIPVVDQYEYMLSKGLGYKDVTFPHDAHLNVLGHQTSAEALWEYFKSHPGICD